MCKKTHLLKLTMLHRHWSASNLRGLLLLEEGLDALVLSIEVSHVNHQVLHHKHVWEGGNLTHVSWVAVHLAQAGKAILAVQVHGT